jgi:hypothetical protein
MIVESEARYAKQNTRKKRQETANEDKERKEGSKVKEE